MNNSSLHITGGKDLPGFHNMLGYRQVSWEENEAVIELEIQADHLNLGGVIHGGVLTSCWILPWPKPAHTAHTRAHAQSHYAFADHHVYRAVHRRRNPGDRS